MSVTTDRLRSWGTFDEAAEDRTRRIAGGICGLVLGLIYAFVSTTIDWLILRDVSYRLDGERVLTTTLTTAALSLALGLITAWSRSFVKGVIAGALSLSIGGTLYWLIASRGSLPVALVLGVTVLSRAWIGAFIVLPMRGLVQWYMEGGLERWTFRWRPLAATVLIGGLMGSLSQMPAEAQAAVRQTDAIMRNALEAADPTDLPSSLARIPDFRARAGTTYQLDQREVPFAAQRLIEVRVYFDNGFTVSCEYAPQATPVCEEMR